MDDTRGLWRLGAARDRPGARLLRPGGEESHKMKKRIAGADQPIETGLLQTDRGEVFVAIAARQHGDFRFDLGGNGDRGRAFRFGPDFDLLCELIAAGGGRLIDIANVKHRQRGEEAERMEGLFLVGLALGQPRRLAVAQQRQRARHEIERLLCLLVAALGFFAQSVDAPLQAFEIGEHQLGLDGFDIVERIDASRDVDHVRVLEAAHDVDDRVGFADMGEELITQAFAFRGAATKPAISTNSTGRHDPCGLTMASSSSRGSGTSTMPTFGSIVQNG